MGKKSNDRSVAGDDLLVRGSGKKFKKKGEENGKAKKVVTVVALILAAVLVLGIVATYSVYSSGIIQRKTVAAESADYTVTSSMMTYFYNSHYRNFVASSSSYLQYMGLDTAKSLEEQDYSAGVTWHDQMIASVKSQTTELLVLCEAARAEGISLDDEDKAEIDSSMKTLETYATSNKVTTDYYIKAMYGSSVTESDVRACLELITLADKYQQKLVDSYDYSETDWSKYYEENADTFLKIDYLSYTFEVPEADDETADTTAAEDTVSEPAETEAETAADTTAAEAEPSEPAAERGYAEELATSTDDESFLGYVQHYLKDIKYAGMDDAALTADSIDIDAEVEKCLTEGASVTTDSDFIKWAKDDARKPYEIYTDYKDSDGTYKVYMLMPAPYEDGLDFTCKYRQAYNLMDYRYIYVDSADYADMTEAKTTADTILAEYKDNATEDKFAELASPSQYGDGNYDGGLIESADRGALDTSVDKWVSEDGRKEGDVEIIESSDGKGYYVVYFKSPALVKWENDANEALKSAKYQEDVQALNEKYPVTYKKKGVGFVKSVPLA